MRSGSEFNTNLEVFLYSNRLQLAAKSALYSDGQKYTPAIAAVNHFKSFLPTAKSVLVLGTGLASIVHILQKKGCHPDFTLVEQDKVILKWAMEFMGSQPGKITPVCMDALEFMKRNDTVYDFVFIDIFDDLTVPSFVYSKEFLTLCKAAIAPGGHLAFNYIASNAPEEERVQSTFGAIFPGWNVVRDDRNQVFVF